MGVEREEMRKERKGTYRAESRVDCLVNVSLARWVDITRVIERKVDDSRKIKLVWGQKFVKQILGFVGSEKEMKVGHERRKNS